MIDVHHIPFACNVQDLLPECRHKARVAATFTEVREAVAFIKAQEHPIDYYLTWR